ncbi:MAG: M3 family oligoendopeptidase, partial [Oscillospiraceae bacterium]|nr:M3 family oligoendopeptidase [Oscillospiraceae bacterium]
MKFSEMKYSRPNLEDVQKLVGSALEKFGAAKSADDAFKAYEEIDTEFARFTTMGCLAFIRHSLDTTNEFYSAEQDYFDEVTPLIEELNQEVKKVLVNTPYRSELEREWGKQLFLNTEIQMKTFSPEIIPLMQEENKLSTEYDKLIASVQIEYDGKTLTLAQLEPYHLDVNAEVRRASWNARAAWFEEHKERLDSLFDELVKVRTKMAVTLGYKNYIELGYYRMTRN